MSKSVNSTKKIVKPKQEEADRFYHTYAENDTNKKEKQTGNSDKKSTTIKKEPAKFSKPEQQKTDRFYHTYAEREIQNGARLATAFTKEGYLKQPVNSKRSKIEPVSFYNPFQRTSEIRKAKEQSADAIAQKRIKEKRDARADSILKIGQKDPVSRAAGSTAKRNDLLSRSDAIRIASANNSATVKKPDGLLEKGNIDLNNRKVVYNPDGTFSTERSFSTNIDGKEVLLPTVINGKIVSEKEAINHYLKTGEHLGKFDTPDNATKYAQQLHAEQERKYRGNVKDENNRLIVEDVEDFVPRKKETPEQMTDQPGMSFYDQSVQNQKDDKNSRLNQIKKREDARYAKGLSDYIASNRLLSEAYNNLGKFAGDETGAYRLAMNPKIAQQIIQMNQNAQEVGIGNETGDIYTMDRRGRREQKQHLTNVNNMLTAQRIPRLQDEYDRAKRRWDDTTFMAPDDLEATYGNEYKAKYDRFIANGGQNVSLADFIRNQLQDELDKSESRLTYWQTTVENNNKEIGEIERLDQNEENYKNAMDPNKHKAQVQQLQAEISDLEQQIAEVDAHGGPMAARQIKKRELNSQLEAKKAELSKYDNYSILYDDIEDDATFHAEYDRGQNWEDEQGEIKGYLGQYSRSYKGPQHDASVHGIYSFLNKGNEYEYWSHFNDNEIDARYQGAMAMMPEEVEQFNKLYNAATSAGREPTEAQAFLDALQPYLNQRLRTFEELKNRQKARTNPVSSSIASAVNGMLFPAYAAGTMIGQVAGADWVKDPYNQFFAPARFQGDTESQVAKDLGEVGGFFYKAGMSAAKNFLRSLPYAGAGQLAGEIGTLAGFFGEDYYTTYQQKLEETGNADKAGLYAMTDAMISTFFEIASVEKTFQPTENNLMKFLQIAGAEMSEELSEGLFGQYIHELFDGSNEWKDNAAAIIKAGGYEDENGNWVKVTEENANIAMEKALKDYSAQVLESVTSAGISAGGPAAFSMARAKVQDSNYSRDLGKSVLNRNVTKGMTGRQQYGEQVDSFLKLKEAAKLMGEDSEASKIADQIEEESKNKNKFNVRTVGKLVRAIVNESNEQIGNIAKDVLGESFLKTLKTNGVGQTEAADLTERLVRVITQGASTREQMLQDMVIIRGNAAAQQILNDYGDSEARKQFLQGTEAAREAQNSVMELITGPKESGITTDSVSGLMAGAQAATTEDIAEADAAGKRSGSALEVIADGLYSEIKGFTTRNVKGEDGKNHSVVMVQIGEGDTAREVDISAVKGLSDGAAKVLQVIGADRGQVIGNETAKTLLQIAGKTTKNIAGTVSDAMNTMWAAAMEQKAPATSLDAETAAQIRSAVQADMDAAEAKRLQNWRAIKPGQGTTTYNGLSYGTKEFNDALSKLGSTHRNEANVIGNYAKSMGVDVQLYYDENTSAQQGVYFGGQDGAGIRINLAGTINKEGAHRSAVATFAHEVTHNIEANSPTAYKALRSFVLQNMGAGLQNSLQHIMDNYAAHGESIDLNGALAELVAMGSEQVLTNEKLAAQLKEQDTTLYGRVQHAVNRLIKQIRGIRGDVMATSSRYARAMQNVGDEIARIWVAAYEEAKGTTAPAEISTINTGSQSSWMMNPEEHRKQTINIKRAINNPEKYNNYFTYDSLIKKDPIRAIQLDPIDTSKTRRDILDNGMANARKYGVERRGEVFVHVYDAGTDVRITEKGLRHDLNDTEKDQGIIERIGEVLQEAVVINTASSRIRGQDGQYKLLGAAVNSDGKGITYAVISVNKITNTVERVDTLKSVRSTGADVANNKKTGATRARASANNSVRLTVFPIKIADALEAVKDIYNDVLPLDVLNHFNVARKLTKDTQYLQHSFSDEEYMDAVNRGDMITAQQMVDEAAKAAGYTLKVYHGTPTGGFTVFRDWSYFTENKAYADRYNHASASSIRGSYETTTPQTYELYMNPGKVFDTRKAKERRLYNEARMEYGLNGLEDMKRGLPDWTDGRDIIEFLEDRGLDYDTILLDEGGDGGYGAEVVDRGISYVSRSNRVKSAETVTYDNDGNIIPLSERFKEEKKDIRFSMQMPVEERADGLIAVHNLTARNLYDTLMEGGFTAPSIAVIAARMGHTKYGEISAVFKPEAIDPKRSRRNKVYGTDAWTPTRSNAQIETRLNYKALQNARDTIDDTLKGKGEEWRNEALNWINRWLYEDSTTDTMDEMIDRAYRNGGMIAAYYAANNKTLERKTKTEQVHSEIHEQLIDQYNAFLDKLEEKGLLQEFMEDMDNETGNFILNKYINTFRESGELHERLANTYEEKRDGHAKTIIFARMKAARRFEQDGRKILTEEVYDKLGTIDAARDNVDKKDFDKWVSGLLKGALGEKGVYNGSDLFTRSGTRRGFKATHDEPTAENIVKAMYKNHEAKGGEAGGATGLMAKASKEYNSLDEIRADSGRLQMLEEEEYKTLVNALDDKLNDFAKRISQNSKYDYYTVKGILIEAGEAYAKQKTATAIERYLRQEGINLTQEQINEAQQLFDEAQNIPTGYFEAKPETVKSFDELEKIIMPEDSELERMLLERNIPYEIYDGTEEDRLRILNEQTNALFSMQDDTDYDVKAWMETVPEWSLRTEAEKALLRSYGSLRRKGQMDQLRMEKIDAEIKRLERMQGKSATSEGTPVTTVTVDEALKANGIEQDGAMLKQNGVIIGSLQTGVLNIYDKYKEIRKKLQDSGAFEYDEKLHAWTAKAQNIYADQERDVQKRLGELRIRKQNLQKTMDETNEQLAKITGNEGFGNMMYRQHKVVEDLAYNKTQAEVRDSIEKMENSAKRVQGIIDENRKKADELEGSDVVKRFRELLGTTTADQTAADLKKEFSSTWTKKQIREFLDPIILKMKSGEDFTQDVETLAGILVNSDSRNTYEELEALRGLTITLGKGAQAELKAQNSSLKEIRARLAGTGITVKYGDRSTLEADIDNLRAEYPMIPELGDEKDALQNFVSWVEGMKNQSAGNEFYDQRLAEAMAMITGKAAGAAKGIYMPNDPKAQRQVLAMMDFVKGLNAETQQAQEALQQVADEMGAMQKAGREASGKTDVLMRDVNVALDYYNRISKISVDEAKQKRTSALIEQLKSETAQKIIKNNEEWRQLIQRDADARKQLDENRKAAAQINTSLRRMYNLLKAPKGTKNIPEYMQGLAREVLGIFARNDADGGRRFLNSTRDGLAELQRLLEAWEKQDGPFDPSDLSAAEEAVTINLLQDLDIIREGITAINTPVNGKNKLDTLQQRGVTMRNIRDAVSEIYSAIRAEQEVQIGNRRVAVEDAAYKIAEATNGMSFREWTGKMGGAISWMHKAFVSGNMTPEYFFRTIGNEGLNDLWDAYHWAENRNGLELAKAQARLDEIAKQHGFDQWDMGQTIKLPLEGGETELTLGQLMSLWATWKREKTLGPAMSEHLTKGGFFAEKDLRDGWLGRTAIERRAHRVTEEDMAKVRDLLTDEQRKFVDDVVLFMSRDMSELGNAASMAAYGIRMYKEKYYFPFQMWDGVKSRKSNDAGSAAAAQDRAFHPSFSKDRKHGADNAIAIGDFMQTATDHIAGMINYATMGLANETMQKVLNAQTAQGPYETKRNTRAILEEAYGKEAMQYLSELQLQLNGGAVRTSRSLGDKAISIFRKNAVAGSLSVALQQPLSYIRAMTMINPKYLTKAALSEYWKDSYKERMAYSGVSVIKEMGRFDMALGQSAREYLMPDGKESTGRKIWEGVKEYSTILPELMDRWTWNRMWVAVKAEQHALHPEMDVKSDAFLTMVGERFNELMRRTQVYDSVLVKSANMRNDNYFVKSITSFMAEPTLTINVLADAVRSAKQGEPGGKKLLAYAGASFMLGAVLQSVFKALMSTGRTPDEKKTWLENFLYRWFTNLQSEIDPLTLIPGYSTAVDLLKGSDISDNALGAIGKLFTAGQKGVDMLLGNGKNGWYRDLEDSFGQIMQLFSGLPLKNLMRDGRAMWNWAIDQPYAKRDIDWNVVKYQSIDSAMSADNFIGVLMQYLGESGYETSSAAYKKRVYEAMRDGDEKAAQDYMDYLLNGKGVKSEKSIMTGTGSVTSYVMKDYQAGNITRTKADELLKKANPNMKDQDRAKKLDEVDYEAKTGKEVDSFSLYMPLFDAMDQGEKAEIDAQKKHLEEIGVKKNTITSQMKGHIKDQYKEGVITRKKAEEMLKKYAPELKQQDIIKVLDEIDYENETGKDVESYSLYTRIYEAIDKGDASTIRKQKSYLKTVGIEEKDVNSQIVSYISSQYKDGKMRRADAESRLKNFAGKDADDAFWTLDRIEFKKATGTEASGTYYRLWYAMDANKSTDIQSAVNTMTGHGVEAKNIKSQISSHYKQEYLKASDSGKVKIRDAMEKAYKALGLSEKEVNKTIKKWK